MNAVLTSDPTQLVSNLKSEVTDALSLPDIMCPGRPTDLRAADRAAMLLSHASFHPVAAVRASVASLMASILPYLSPPFLRHLLQAQPDWEVPMPTDLIHTMPSSLPHASLARMLPVGAVRCALVTPPPHMSRIPVPRRDKGKAVDDYSSQLASDINHTERLIANPPDESTVGHIATLMTVHKLLTDIEPVVRRTGCCLLPALAQWLEAHGTPLEVHRQLIALICVGLADVDPQIRAKSMEALWHMPGMTQVEDRPVAQLAVGDHVFVPWEEVVIMIASDLQPQALMYLAFKANFPETSASLLATQLSTLLESAIAGESAILSPPTIYLTLTVLLRRGIIQPETVTAVIEKAPSPPPMAVRMAFAAVTDQIGDLDDLQSVIPASVVTTLKCRPQPPSDNGITEAEEAVRQIILGNPVAAIPATTDSGRVNMYVEYLNMIISGHHDAASTKLSCDALCQSLDFPSTGLIHTALGESDVDLTQFRFPTNLGSVELHPSLFGSVLGRGSARTVACLRCSSPLRTVVVGDELWFGALAQRCDVELYVDLGGLKFEL